ncbi:cx9C motif-containing protein 4 [Drosophila grimshawi]|uniref:cx9C motif-containing protein 4 n=1 Tax=Drosophila grimshawi TaxID=7222 RepID=UPI000C86F0ED|nr:cx9C motif-containing protein 4 [Drosophila grimshawi]
MPKVSKDPCKLYACRIQSCLRENNYQEDRCTEVLEEMRICCLKWHKKSLCCSGINLEEPRLEKPKSKGTPKSSSGITNNANIISATI